MAQWFYEKDGKPTGPVSQLEIARLIISGSVKEDTLVWTSSFGEQWRRADEAGLPRVVSRKITGTEKSAEAEASAIVATSFLEALEKRQASLSSFWAILLFAMPIIANILSGLLLDNSGDITAGLASTYLREMILLFVILLTCKVLIIKKDRKAMAEAGYRPLSYWWLLLPPGYFLLRWERTKKYFGLFLVTTAFLFCTVVELILPSIQQQVAEMQKNMPVVSGSSTPQSQNNQAISLPKKEESKK